jgi:aminopeptidase-like protein
MSGARSLDGFEAGLHPEGDPGAGLHTLGDLETGLHTNGMVHSMSDAHLLGREMHELMRELYPICRSITGEGVRQSLAILQRRIPLEIHEVPTGEKVLDWVVPQEWNIRDAYIMDGRGRRVLDFQRSNLHVVGYSVPVRQKLTLSALREHLHTLPEHSAWIPYRTSYYQPSWGFCLAHERLVELEEAEYDVLIDSELKDGHLTYGECYLPGELADEVLISAHVCHPSMCNDNLSGMVVATYLAARIGRRPHRYSYRFLFAPGTIGSITWLSRNEARACRVKHGLVLAGIGDAGDYTYKRTRRQHAEIDRAVERALAATGRPYTVEAFSPYGYDERQFNSPGFNLAVGCLMRSRWGTYPEYHTSADDLDFVKPGSLAGSLGLCELVFDILERNRTYLNQNPKGEPQLGRRGLYTSTGGSSAASRQLALLWVLNLSDGSHALLDIAERSGLDFDTIGEAAEALEAAGLLEEQPSR